jgi:hypothetical protein
MIARGWTVSLVLLVALAGSVFQLKNAVVDLERERRALKAEIAETSEDIRRLVADEAVLTRPERLARLAAQIDLVPGGAARLVDIAEIGLREQLLLTQRSLDAALPSGQLVTLRLKPVSSPASETIALAR